MCQCTEKKKNKVTETSSRDTTHYPFSIGVMAQLRVRNPLGETSDHDVDVKETTKTNVSKEPVSDVDRLSGVVNT